MERLVLAAWEEIRGDDALLARYGWPVSPRGRVVSGEQHTDVDDVTSFVAAPRQTCVAVPYWHHPRDAGKRPRDVRMAPYDPLVFGGSGLGGGGDQCFNGSMFGRARYTVGNWNKPQTKLPNGRAHAGYWGSEGRCLRRPFDSARTTAFVSEGKLRQLLHTCEMPFEQWMLLYQP